MTEASPDIVVYVCQNCIPPGARLPRQWDQEGAHVVVRQAPCTGKIDGQYLFRGLESGLDGVCIVACPKGQCHLTQGNYRAEMRIRTGRKLLTEIGMQPERLAFIHVASTDAPESLEPAVRQAVAESCRTGPSPLRSAAAPADAKAV